MLGKKALPGLQTDLMLLLCRYNISMELMRMLKMPSIVIVCTLILPAYAFGETYKSEFGFELDIPKDWSVLSWKQLEKLELEKLTQQAEIDPTEKREAIHFFERVRKGQYEVYYQTEEGHTISVHQQAGRAAQTKAEAVEACTIVSKQLLAAYQKGAKVIYCRLQNSGGVDHIALEYTITGTGKSVIQCEFQKTPQLKLTVMAEVNGTNRDLIRQMHERISEAIGRSIKGNSRGQAK